MKGKTILCTSLGAIFKKIHFFLLTRAEFGYIRKSYFTLLKKKAFVPINKKIITFIIFIL